MLGRDPTLLGTIDSLTGAVCHVRQSASVQSGLSLFQGQTYKIGQIGSFVRIPQGYQDLFGVISKVGAEAMPGNVESRTETGRWVQVELVGQALGTAFGRGIGQYPNVGDAVHIAVEEDMHRIYDIGGQGHIFIGKISSAEIIPARISLNELLTRHSAILGSTGSGKSTTVTSLLRAITSPSNITNSFPNSRILLLDIHGEYSTPMADIAEIFSVAPQENEESLCIPYWALDSDALLEFLVGPIEGNKKAAFIDKIIELKSASHELTQFFGVESGSITVDTPLPFSLKQLWYDLIESEIATFEDHGKEKLAKKGDGDPNTLAPPTYWPHGKGSSPPFKNQNAVQIQPQLELLRSKLFDRRYDFLLRPGPWEPNLRGKTEEDLDTLLRGWLGGDKPISILNLSEVPSNALVQLVGSILKIVFDSLFWSQEKSEGGVDRPLLIVMEEAHRYLSSKSGGLALEMGRRIVKEGRKYGVGAMVVSQRPSEVDETILSQCGTYFALRLANPDDRARVRGTLPDGLVGLLDVLPVLRTGEAIVIGEATKLPMRCRVTLPPKERRPQSEDPNVSESWGNPKAKGGYDRIVASWRSQSQLRHGIPQGLGQDPIPSHKMESEVPSLKINPDEKST